MVAVIKASILAMYYRIFPTRSMKWGVHILGGSVVLWWLARCKLLDVGWNQYATTGLERGRSV